MKNIKILFLLLVSTITFLSCGSNENEGNTSINSETISAKWFINNDTYESVEFNEDGKYILIKTTGSSAKKEANKSSSVTLLGNYTISGETVTLINFGEITITNITDDSISFEITDNDTPDITITVDANKVTKIEDSTNTNLLCRTWKMDAFNGESVVGTEYELTVIFSTAGTYFVEFENPIEDSDGGVAEWKWSNTSETSLCYSWDGTPTCVDDYQVSVTVTSETLTIIEESEIYELIPINATSSAKQVLSSKKTSFKNGIFKK